MISQCLISFGSNLGHRDSVIAEAARRIAAWPGVGDLRSSRLFETPPIGGPGGQEPFLNAVAAFDTTLSARDILGILQATEDELGRRRRDRWGARSIDLDVVLHGALVGGGTGLIIPHPRYTARQFVLQPACDVAGHYRDPRFGWTMKRLAAHISSGVPSLALVGGDVETRRLVCERLTAEHGLRTFQGAPLGDPMAVVGRAPASMPRPAPSSSPDANPKDTAVPSRTDESPHTDGGDGAVVPAVSEPWVSAFVPPLPPLGSDATEEPSIPRLVARMQRTTLETRWPAPHQMWPAGWDWPEYRLEVDDLDWTITEIASAIESMRCPVRPVSETGDWWR